MSTLRNIFLCLALALTAPSAAGAHESGATVQAPTSDLPTWMTWIDPVYAAFVLPGFVVALALAALVLRIWLGWSQHKSRQSNKPF